MIVVSAVRPHSLSNTSISSKTSCKRPIVSMSLMARLTQSIHLCFGLPLLFLPGGTISSLSSGVFLVSPLYVAKPPAPICYVLYLQFLPDVIISHMVSSFLSLPDSCMGASHWHCLRHLVQNSWVNNHLVIDYSRDQSASHHDGLG